MNTRLVTVLDTVAGQTPTIDLNFAGTKTLDARVTFTRGSTGTYINSAGLVATASSGVPRFTHDPVSLASLGFLVEESRTNLLLRSEECDNAAWSKNATTISANAAAAPDGLTSADKIIPSVSNAVHYVDQTVVNSGNTTFSVFAKAAGYGFLGLALNNNGSLGAIFNLTTGAVTYSGGSLTATSAVQFPGGWWRLSISTGTSIGSAQLYAQQSGSGFSSYAGDGTSGILIWGAQLEAGSFATSYIPTTGASATRAADVATITGTNFSSWYRQGEGTILIEFSNPPATGANFMAASVDDGTSSNRIQVGFTSGNPIAGIAAGGVNQFFEQYSEGAATSRRIALSFGGAGVSIVSLGVVLAAKSAFVAPANTRLAIGMDRFNGAYLNVPIARVRYWPRRLPDSRLQTLTSS